MRFQTQYDIDIARIKEKNVSKIKRTEEWKIIKEYVNISYLKKRNLLNDSLEDCISMVKNIFVFNTIDELIQNYSSYKGRYALYKKSEKLKIDEKNLFTWEMVCKKLVKSKSVGIYSNEKIESLKSELNVLFYENNNVLSKTESLLNKFGIKFLVQEKLDKTPVDGITFWSENNPTIVVTLRKKNLDNFAFTIMHELGHIAMHLDTDRATTILDIENINEENVREIEKIRETKRKITKVFALS
jgi:HTH-type transcriptional regulator/antitoxin HigA